MNRNHERKLMNNLSRLYQRQFEVALQNMAVYEAEKKRLPMSEQLWNLRNA